MHLSANMLINTHVCALNGACVRTHTYSHACTNVYRYTHVRAHASKHFTHHYEHACVHGHTPVYPYRHTCLCLYTHCHRCPRHDLLCQLPVGMRADACVDMCVQRCAHIFLSRQFQERTLFIVITLSLLLHFKNGHY